VKSHDLSSIGPRTVPIPCKADYADCNYTYGGGSALGRLGALTGGGAAPNGVTSAQSKYVRPE
jgi:hypothetical protein